MAELEELYVPHIGWFAHEPGDDVARFLAEGWFEFREQAFFWLYLRSGDLLVDAGAHAGLYTLLGSHAGARVVALEPNPSARRALEANIRAHECTGVEVIPKGLDRAAGCGLLTIPAQGLPYASLTGGQTGDSVEVEVVAIDDLDLGKVALLKLDIEGFELRALEGAAESIRRDSLPVCLIEFTPANLERASSSANALFAHLRGLGYDVCALTGDLQITPLQEPVPSGHENYLAVRDLEFVSHRIATAAPDRQRIAGDLLRRGPSALAAANLRQHLEQANVRLAMLDEVYGRLSAADWTISDLRDRLDKVTAERDARGGEIAALRMEIAGLHSQLQCVVPQRDDLDRKLQAKEAELDASYARIGAAEWTIGDLQARLDRATTERDARGGEIAALHEEIAGVRAELQKARQAQDQLR